ncbi:hypothetical protein DFH09DRAFT_1087202 [Mycena vulgaris]|nr:hypothetical protein DFH09DRAFT_1087202 [Mycena vulgaris]
MTSPLAPTFGIWMVAPFFMSILLGMGLLQVYLSKIEHFRNLPETSGPSTNNLLNFFIRTAINRGVLTMIPAALNMTLFLTQPGTFYSMFVLLISGKFYMNSMVAMLNTRRHAHAISRFGQTQTTVDHIAMNSFVPAGNIQGANVSVAHETLNDGSDTGLGLRGDGKLVL